MVSDGIGCGSVNVLIDESLFLCLFRLVMIVVWSVESVWYVWFVLFFFVIDIFVLISFVMKFLICVVLLFEFGWYDVDVCVIVLIDVWWNKFEYVVFMFDIVELMIEFVVLFDGVNVDSVESNWIELFGLFVVVRIVFVIFCIVVVNWLMVDVLKFCVVELSIVVVVLIFVFVVVVFLMSDCMEIFDWLMGFEFWLNVGMVEFLKKCLKFFGRLNSSWNRFFVLLMMFVVNVY